LFELLLGPGGGLFGDNTLYQLIFYIPFILFLFYGQKLQSYMILGEVSRAMGRLKILKEKSRKEAMDYITSNLKPQSDTAEKIDQILEYFTIMPVDMDPSGIVGKLEHTFTIRDDRIKSEIRVLATEGDLVQKSAAENILEAATALNFIFKIIRHFYVQGKRTSNIYVLISLQMIMPMILQQANALMEAIDAFKQIQPIGDGIGPMIVGKMMLDYEKKEIARDTLLTECQYNNRTLYLIKSTGPGGNVGEPGKAVEKLINEIEPDIKLIIMIDAALKLEGEKTGEIAEGIGAAIGGIGVDRFKIEETASKRDIPMHAIVVKQSLLDAISVMKKEIAETAGNVSEIVYRIIDEKTKEEDKVLIVGVGNTLGVAQ